MQPKKDPVDWTPDEFIQHSANLDHYERILSGMARLGENTTNPELYKAMDATVKKYRLERQAYFTHHKITSDISKPSITQA